MSYIGTNKIGKMYLGGTEIAKAYLGSSLVYQKIHSSKISGIAPLTFQANAGDIRSLIQYGKCEQRNDLPPGCVEIEYLESTGTQYIDTGIVVSSTDNMFIDFQKTTSHSYQAFYAGRRTTANNATSYSLGQINSKFDGRLGSGTLGYGTSINLNRHTLELDPVNGNVIQDSSTTASCGSFASSNLTVYLFGVNTNGAAGYSQHPIRVFEFSISDKIHLIPVRVGPVGYMYDRVSGQLFGNSGTGDFILGPDVVPTPDKPIDIWCNNGILKAKHQSGLPLGYTRLDYIESTGTQYIDTGVIPNQDSRIFLDVLIPRLYTGACSFGGSANGSLTPGFIVYGDNTTYKTASVYNNSDVIASSISYAANVRYTIDLNKNIYTVYNGATRKYYYSHPTGNFQLTQPIELFRINISTPRYGQFRLYQSRIYQDDVLVRHYIPSKNYNNEIGLYDLVTNTFFINSGTGYFTAGSETQDPIVVYADGTPEVLTISATGQSTQTATAKNLLQTGDYKDTQDIISGHITRKVGILVLDGTESWQLATQTDLMQFYISSTQGVIANNVSLISTITPYGCTVATRTQYDFGCFSDASGNLCFQMKGSSTLTTVPAWRSFLVNQYNAGTPVIIVYPLATETTESVTAQHLTTTSGENTIDITANVSDISVEVECLT